MNNNNLTIKPIAITMEVVDIINSSLLTCECCNKDFMIEAVEDVEKYGELAFKLCELCITNFTTATEYCYCCESEVELENKFEVQNCPVCENEIYPCSLCDMDTVKCSDCQFNKNLNVIRALKNVTSGYIVSDNEFEYINIDKALHCRKINTSYWDICTFGLRVSNTYKVTK